MAKLFALSLTCLLMCGAPRAVGHAVQAGHGLNGPVHTVLTKEQVILEDDGKETVGQIEPLSLVTFDRAGKIVESVAYSDGGTQSRRVVYKYDAGGKRRTGLVAYNPSGEVVRRVEDTFGSVGLRASRTVHDYEDDGTLLRKVVFTFDRLGELQEVAEYGPEGTLKHTERAPFTDSTHRNLSYLSPVPDTHTARDHDEDRVVGGGGTGSYTPSETDEHGNWTKNKSREFKEYKSGRRTEKTVITYRTFTYYEADKEGGRR